MSDIEKKRKQLRSWFATGAVVVVLSLLLWVIPSVIIGGIEARMYNLESQSALTTTESNLLSNLGYSRNWWEITKISVLEPIAMVVLVIGLFLIAYGFIIRFI